MFWLTSHKLLLPVCSFLFFFSFIFGLVTYWAEAAVVSSVLSCLLSSFSFQCCAISSNEHKVQWGNTIVSTTASHLSGFRRSDVCVRVCTIPLCHLGFLPGTPIIHRCQWFQCLVMGQCSIPVCSLPWTCSFWDRLWTPMTLYRTSEYRKWMEAQLTQRNSEWFNWALISIWDKSVKEIPHYFAFITQVTSSTNTPQSVLI